MYGEYSGILDDWRIKFPSIFQTAAKVAISAQPTPGIFSFQTEPEAPAITASTPSFLDQTVEMFGEPVLTEPPIDDQSDILTADVNLERVFGQIPSVELDKESWAVPQDVSAQIEEQVQILAQSNAQLESQVDKIIEAAKEIYATTEKNAENSIQEAIDTYAPDSGIDPKWILYGLAGIFGFMLLKSMVK